MGGGGGGEVKMLVHRVSFSQTGPVCVSSCGKETIHQPMRKSAVDVCNHKAFLGTHTAIVIQHIMVILYSSTHHILHALV